MLEGIVLTIEPSVTVVKLAESLNRLPGIDLIFFAFTKVAVLAALPLNAPLLRAVTLYVAFVIFVSFTVAGTSIAAFFFPSAERPISFTLPATEADAGCVTSYVKSPSVNFMPIVPAKGSLDQSPPLILYEISILDVGKTSNFLFSL